MTTAIHPGGLNAAQSLAFFHANGIVGRVVQSRSRSCVLVEYSCMTVHLNGIVAASAHRILAPAQNQIIASA